MLLRVALVLIAVPLLAHGADGLFAGPDGRPPLEMLVAVLALWPFSRPRQGGMAASGAAPLSMPRIMLVNLAPGDTVDDIESAPPLGSQDEVRAQIGASLAGISFDTTGHGTFSAPGGSVDVELGTSEPVYAAVVTVRGNAGRALARLLEESGWRAFAPRPNTWLSVTDLRRKPL